jgi:putative radical SAM enzyme (TIGR03279 family)
MTDKDIARIVKMRFSPINISIHTTNPELRVKMMKNKRAGEVLKYISTLAEAGISMCGQIVLCRGVNDGEELRRSITELSEYFPRLSSLAVVPAGLTKHREGLYPLTDFTREEARAVIDLINGYGDEYKEKFGERFVYAADEFYLKAGLEIPGAEYYEEYPQLENGVGMLRSFKDEFIECLEDIDPNEKRAERTVSIATGVASYQMISELSELLMSACPSIEIKAYKIINNFYGESVTVSGLLTGKDIFEQLQDKELGELLIVPKNALRQGEDSFLCDMTLGELSEKLRVPIEKSGEDGYELCSMLLSEM